MPLYVLIPFSTSAPLRAKCLSGSFPLRRLLRPWPPALFALLVHDISLFALFLAVSSVFGLIFSVAALDFRCAGLNQSSFHREGKGFSSR